MIILTYDSETLSSLLNMALVHPRWVPAGCCSALTGFRQQTALQYNPRSRSKTTDERESSSSASPDAAIQIYLSAIIFLFLSGLLSRILNIHRTKWALAFVLEKSCKVCMSKNRTLSADWNVQYIYHYLATNELFRPLTCVLSQSTRLRFYMHSTSNDLQPFANQCYYCV